MAAQGNVSRRKLVVGTVGLVAAAGATLVVLSACGDLHHDDHFADVAIKGKTFHLELALDPETRFHGLSGRESIPDNGGMLFVFPTPMTTAFVMRDCPIPIDIIFLDGSGRVTATHKMLAEPPRAEDEKPLNERGVNEKYEDRLKKYPSGFAAQFVIELKGNTLDSLNMKKAEKIDLDIVGLKKKAK